MRPIGQAPLWAGGCFLCRVPALASRFRKVCGHAGLLQSSWTGAAGLPRAPHCPQERRLLGGSSLEIQRQLQQRSGGFGWSDAQESRQQRRSAPAQCGSWCRCWEGVCSLR